MNYINYSTITNAFIHPIQQWNCIQRNDFNHLSEMLIPNMCYALFQHWCIWFNFILRCTFYLGFLWIGKTFETTCYQIIWYARNSQRYSLYLSGYKLTPMKRHVSDKWPEKLPHQDSQTASIKFNTRYK